MCDGASLAALASRASLRGEPLRRRNTGPKSAKPVTMGTPIATGKRLPGLRFCLAATKSGTSWPTDALVEPCSMALA
jgi:hypothetical protein